MSRPLRFPCRLATIDAIRWPHTVDVQHHAHVALSATYRFVLRHEIEVWLRENVRQDGWRFSRDVTEKGTLKRCAYRVHFTHDVDAFAFRMRWS